MAKREGLIKGYAQALFSVAEAEGALDTVGDELFRFSRAMEKQTRLRNALTDIAFPADRKRKVLIDVLGKKANPHSVNLLGFVIEQGRARDLGPIVDELVRLAAERRQRAVAEVRTAVRLSGVQRKRLAEALSRATGKQIELKVIVDPESVIGGVVARVGDQVFDGSVRRRLELVRERMSEV
ncbi:MAG TPA: ATP synthase F1 subunit delta [Actinomycetota bacterium]|jgi:F-type H+-transporting ATPase subunit delta|nr:ATP synthase F1 subunit delta [Actinomycetota bacterium]